jgi:Protein of unknown function (DUF2380)
MIGRTITIILALAALCSPAVAGSPTAVFPFELIDTSHQGELSGLRADETQRLVLVTEELRRLVASDGRYGPIDVSGISAEIERAAPLHKCNGCEANLAKTVGAELAMTGTVQKVSNLILNLNVYVRAADSGKLMRAMSVDIRGNTDETWLRGIRYLVKNQLLAEEVPR